jgi:hypothetical protein
MQMDVHIENKKWTFCLLLPLGLRTSSGFLHLFLQSLFGDFAGKLIDCLRDSFKQVVKDGECRA